MKIYAGNLSYDTTEQDIKQEFEAFGTVDTVSVVMDKYSGRPKGFAFVEMPTKSEAEAAIEGLNGKTIDERTIVVNESRPRTENRGGGGYGNRGGGFGGRKGGGGGGGGRQRRY